MGEGLPQDGHALSGCKIFRHRVFRRKLILIVRTVRLTFAVARMDGRMGGSPRDRGEGLRHPPRKTYDSHCKTSESHGIQLGAFFGS